MECKCSGKRQKTDHKRDTFISQEEQVLAKDDIMSTVLSFLGSLRDFSEFLFVSKTTAGHIFTFMDEQVKNNMEKLPTHGWISFDGTSLDQSPWRYHSLVGDPMRPNVRNFLFKQLLLQKESTPAFDEAFSDGEIQLSNNNRRLSMCGVGDRLHIGCGISNRILLPGQSYRMSVQFRYRCLHHKNLFGIIRPIKCSSGTVSQIIQGRGFMFMPEHDTIPSRWKKQSSINTVMWNPRPSSSVSVSRGSRSGSDLQREGGWDLFCQFEWTENTGLTVFGATFELDYEDPSNGKLNFVYLDDNDEQKHLITEGSTGDYVWAGSVGVYHNKVTSMEIM